MKQLYSLYYTVFLNEALVHNYNRYGMVNGSFMDMVWPPFLICLDQKDLLKNVVIHVADVIIVIASKSFCGENQTENESISYCAIYRKCC